MTVVHRCRFIDFVPKAINVISASPAGTRPLVAVAREDGAIELWDPLQNWSLAGRIPGSKLRSIEAMVWVDPNPSNPLASELEALLPAAFSMKNSIVLSLEQRASFGSYGRLLTAGLQGTIVEWDLNASAAAREIDSYGGSIWCMAVNGQNTRLAAGCADGCVKIFNIEHGELQYIRSLQRQNGRIVSLAWSADGGLIATGSSEGEIIIYPMDGSSSTISRMLVESPKAGDKTIVWSVAFVADGMLSSGNSLGQVQFWDITNATLIQTFPSHGADVLCLAVSVDRKTVFASGVDNRTIQFRLFERPVGEDQARSETWAVSAKRRLHTHDVRSMTLANWPRLPSMLFSAGVDTNIMIANAHTFSSELLAEDYRLSSFPPNSIIQLAKDARIMMAQLDHVLRLWSLAKATVSDGNPLSLASSTSSIRQLLEFTISRNEGIWDVAISDDACWLAIVTTEGLKIYSLSYDGAEDTRVVVNKIDTIGLKLGNIQLARFLHQSSDLLVVSTETDCYEIRTLSLPDLELVGKIKVPVPVKSELSALQLAIDDATALAAFTHSIGHVELLDLSTHAHLGALPRLESNIACLAFASNSTLIAVDCANQMFHGHVLSRSWETKHLIPGRNKIVGLASKSSLARRTTCWSETHMAIVRLDATMDGATALSIVDPPKARRRAKSLAKHAKHTKATSTGVPTEPRAIRIIKDYRPTLFFDYINEHEAVVVERPWAAVLEALPPTFYRPRYGGR